MIKKHIFLRICAFFFGQALDKWYSGVILYIETERKGDIMYYISCFLMALGIVVLMAVGI
jgi:hypothetical protein